MSDARNLHRVAKAFWGGDDVIAMMMEAEPGTPYFGDLVHLVDKSGLEGVDPLLVGHDLKDLCTARDLDASGLAAILGIPFAAAFAIGCGWRRLSTRGLLTVAERLNVPVGAFVHDEAFQRRPRVRMYESWLLIEKTGLVSL